MGQKVHPKGFRLGVIETWDSDLVRRQERIQRLDAGGPEGQEIHKA